MRSLYYEDGANVQLFQTFEQAVWLFLLACVALGCVLPRGRGDDRQVEPALTVVLALLMLLAFEQVFEARARYLFSSLALFVFMATLGLRGLCLTLGQRRSEAGACIMSTD